MLDGREPVDDVLGALVTRLQAMPASDPRARAAILARVRGRRQSPWRATFALAWQPSVPVLAAAAVVVLALGIGYAGRVLVEPPREPATLAEGNAPAASLIPVSNDVSSSRPVPTQFVFEARGANRVAIVGDFNQWNAAAPGAALQDPTHSGVWQTTIALPPGRHTYAFLVNDSLVHLDPRAPKAVDADFGRSSSVILVTR